MDTARLIRMIEDETGATEVRIHTRIDTIVEDSLEFLDLICTLETAFHFKIPDKRYMEVQTVGDLCSFAADHVSA